MSLLNYASDNAPDASPLPLSISFIEGTTSLSTGPSLNQFLNEADGPFASLCDKVKRNTQPQDEPTPNRLPPLTEVVRNIVRALYGHTNPSKQAEIGDILIGAGINNDLLFQGTYIFHNT